MKEIRIKYVPIERETIWLLPYSSAPLLLVSTSLGPRRRRRVIADAIRRNRVHKTGWLFNLAFHLAHQ